MENLKLIVFFYDFLGFKKFKKKKFLKIILKDMGIISVIFLYDQNIYEIVK